MNRRTNESVPMLEPADQPLPILKGPTFTARLREICGGPLPRRPLDGAKYERILIPGITGGELHWSMMGFLGQALRIRGAEVTALLCDAFLPACVQRKVDHVELACTRWCHRNAGPFAEAMGLPHRWYGEFLSEDERSEFVERARRVPADDLPTFRWRKINVGELITQSVQSAFKVGRFSLDDPPMVAKAYDFLAAAMCLERIGSRVLDELAIDKVVTDNGKQVDWGVLRAVANRQGIPVDVTAIGIRGTSMRFETDRPPHPPARMPAWERWRGQPLTDRQERDLERYLRRRERVPYEYRDERWRSPLTDPQVVARRLGLPRRIEGKTLAMFPNVGFDTGKTKSSAAAFHSAIEWVVATVEMIARWPAHRLIVKAHPSEHHRTALDAVLAEIRRRFDPLPANVHLIDPVTDISAHSVVRLADVVLVYTSTVAAEAAALGKPVFLVGGGWHAERGIATDVRSPEAYTALLEGILSGRVQPKPPGPLGRRYAYCLFFRNDIPIEHFRMDEFNIASLPIESLDDLAPGQDPSMDAICRGVLLDEPYGNPYADADEESQPAALHAGPGV